MIYYLTDDTGMILSIYNYDSFGLELARKHGLDLVKSWPGTDFYMHSGSFATGNLPEVGMTASLKGAERITSGYQSCQCCDGVSHAVTY